MLRDNIRLRMYTRTVMMSEIMIFLKKYTGMTRGELNDWAKNRPHVAGNRLAGSIDVGPASGLGGVAAADGFGGWGPGASAELKFPPQQGKSDEKEV